MASVDMGTATGHVDLDVSGVTEGAKKAKEAFDSIDKASEQSLSEMSKYAQSLTENFKKAYESIADTLKQQEAATQKVIALQNELTEAQNKAAKYQSNAEKYSGIVGSQAAEKYAETLQEIIRIEAELTAAQQAEQQAIQASQQARKQYADISAQSVQKILESEEQVTQAAEKASKRQLELATVNATKVAQARAKAEADAQAKIEIARIKSAEVNATKVAEAEAKATKAAQAKVEQTKVQEQEKTARHQLEVSTANATKVAEMEVKAEKDAQAKIEKAKIDAAQKAASQELSIKQKAQTDIEKAEIAARTKIEQTKIREAERGARQAAEAERRERERATREAEREQEQAARNIANNQAGAFAIATNAVHEVINAVKLLAREMFNLGKQVIEAGANFEQSMAQVAATSGMSAAEVAGNISEYNDLVEAAKEAGATTMFTASQAGEALNYLALAGYNVQESIDTMPDILTIAAAGAMDLGQASDMVTDAMNALDLEIDQTGEFIDKMAKTAQSSNTNVEQLGKSILTVGGTATVLAGGVTELDTAIGLMANSGIKAQQAGTSLRQIILNLTAPASTGAKKIEELGLAVFDAEGKMRPLNEIFQDLNTIMADFTDQERMDAMNDIFDARHIRAANALLQQCGEEWDELAGKIDNADGAAEQMAETMMSTFKGSIITAKSLLESIAITINDGLRENLTALVREAIPKLKELNKNLASPEMQARLQNFSKELKNIALNVLDKVIAELPKIIDHLASLQKNLETLTVVLATVGALKFITDIPKIVAGIAALVAAINPLTVAIVAAGAVLASVIQMEANANAEIEKNKALVKEQNDTYSEQRAAVQGVIDEWERYQETATEITDKAEVQKSKVEALYAEYKKLYEAGEDTTLAMDALAQEIPELNEMLADGKDSFEDITKAVNDYTDALIYNARIEADRNTYVQAIETHTKLKKSLDDIREAANKSSKAVENYENRFNELEKKSLMGTITPEEQTEYEDMIQRTLNGELDALREIAAEDEKARQDAENAYWHSGQAMREAEKGYLESVKKTTKEESEAFSDRNTAIEGANDDYISYLKTSGGNSTEIIAKNGQAAADALTANVNEMKKRIQLRQADEDDLLSVYEGFFGSNQYWDRGNEDLRNHYDTYMGLREKKEKEVRDKMEKDQKERDDLAKKAEKAAKDEADRIEKEWTNSINEGLKDIEWEANFKDWDSDKLAEAYHNYLDDNLEYYESHAEAKKALDRKIQETEKKANEERTKDAKKSAEEYVKNWTSGYDKLVDKAVKAYQQLEKDYDTYRNNLLKGTEITAQQTKKVWDAVSGSYKEEKVEGITSAKELRDNTKQMEETAKFIDQMQAKMGKDASESFMSMFMGMDAEAQEKWMQQWSKMSAGQQQEWINAWKDNQAKADELSDKYFADSLEAWKTNYWQPVQAYAQTGGKELQEAMKLVGEDSVQGWLDGITEKQAEAEGKTKELYGSVLNDAKKTLGIASPSKEFYSIGEFSIEGFLNGIQSKVDQISTIFTNLGQTAGDKFINAFKSTWDSFVTLLNNTGGLQIPVGMTTTTFGTPTVQGSQVYYTGTGTSYTGLTKADVISAIKEAVPDGNVVLQVDEAEFGRISRSSLNLLAEQQGTMDLRV